MSDQTSKLIVFPIDRRMTMVRRAAVELSRLNGEDANAHWRTTAKTLLQDLTAQGREMNDARREVLRFFEAIQLEMSRGMAEQRETIPA